MYANRFKELREKLGLSQVALGDKIGVTQQSVYAWERGDVMPKLQTAIDLANFYHVSLDYLLGLSDDPKKTEPAAVDDELNRLFITLADGLSDSDLQRIEDFAAGLKAARKEPPSHR